MTIYDNIEDAVKESGFDSAREFHNLVARTIISTPWDLAAFEKWKKEDGSKRGLLKLRRES